MATGILIMALMMGGMYLFGHKMGHKHNKHASHEIAVSSSTAISTAAVQNVEPAEGIKDTEHAH